MQFRKAPVFVHLGVNEILVHSGQLCAEQAIHGVDDLVVAFHCRTSGRLRIRNTVSPSPIRFKKAPVDQQVVDEHQNYSYFDRNAEGRHGYCPCARAVEVDFVAVLITEVMEPDIVCVTAALPPQFLVDKGLEKLPQQFAICCQIARVDAEQGCGEPDVTDVQLGRLDETAQSIAVLRWQLISQKHLAPDRNISCRPNESLGIG